MGCFAKFLVLIGAAGIGLCLGLHVAEAQQIYPNSVCWGGTCIDYWNNNNPIPIAGCSDCQYNTYGTGFCVVGTFECQSPDDDDVYCVGYCNGNSNNGCYSQFPNCNNGYPNQ